MDSSDTKVAHKYAISTKWLVAAYRSVYPALRVLVIPIIVGAGSILLNAVITDGYWRVIVLTSLILLVVIQNMLAYLDSQLAQLEVRRARTFQSVVEHLNELVAGKAQRVLAAMKVKNTSTEKMFAAAAQLRFGKNRALLNAALYRTLQAHVRSFKGMEHANGILTLVEPDGHGSFLAIDIQTQMSFPEVIKGRISSLRTQNQKSFGCRLWNMASTYMYSSGNTEQLERSGMFTFLDASSRAHLKSICGYRIDIDGSPRYMWMFDVNIQGALPDTSSRWDHERLDELNDIFSSFAARLAYEHVFNDAANEFLEATRVLVADAAQ